MMELSKEVMFMSTNDNANTMNARSFRKKKETNI